MAIVPDLSGINPGNPALNNWDGTDDHHPTTEELIQEAALAQIAAGAFGLLLQDTATQAAALALLGLPTTPGDVITAAELATALSSYATSAAVTAAISAALVPYLTSANAAATYPTDAEVTGWIAAAIATKPDLADAAPSDLVNALAGVLGVSTQAAKEDHQHRFPLAVINSQTGTTYTVQASDHGKVIECTNASAITLTMPALSIGFNCAVYQGGAGQITVVGSSNTLRNRSTHTKSAGLYAELGIRQRAAAEFVLSGDTAA